MKIYIEEKCMLELHKLKQNFHNTIIKSSGIETQKYLNKINSIKHTLANRRISQWVGLLLLQYIKEVTR
jgi:hypothetical protein